jgi:hypothetical protein
MPSQIFTPPASGGSASSLNTPNGTLGASPSPIQITGGRGGDNSGFSFAGNGGSVSITAGNGGNNPTYAGGNGGDVTIRAGDAGTTSGTFFGTDSDGGNVIIDAGTPSRFGNGGLVWIGGDSKGVILGGNTSSVTFAGSALFNQGLILNTPLRFSYSNGDIAGSEGNISGPLGRSVIRAGTSELVVTNGYIDSSPFACFVQIEGNAGGGEDATLKRLWVAERNVGAQTFKIKGNAAATADVYFSFLFVKS